MMNATIGIDIGTTKLCVVSINTETLETLSVHDAPNCYALAPGEQDAEKIVDKVLSLLKAAVTDATSKGAQIQKIGVTGQMHGIVIADENARAPNPLINWQDQRGAELFTGSNRTYSEELATRLGEESLRKSGCHPATGFGGVTLLRLAHEKNLPRGTALTIHDLVAARLTGRLVTSPSNAASWGIFDCENGSRWLENATDACDISEDILPTILQAGETAGGVLPQIAGDCGLKAGTPVTVAIGDNQASFLGSVQSPDNTLLINLGTGGQMSVSTDRFIRCEGLETRPLLPGKWILVGASLCGGRAYQILAEFFANVGKRLFGIEDCQLPYEQMNRLAAECEKPEITMSTLFNGTRIDASVRGHVENISPANLTAGALSRACIEGMIDELAGYYQKAEAAGAKATTLAGSGNGVRKNPVVRQAVEAKFGMPLYIPKWQEEAARGAI